MGERSGFCLLKRHFSGSRLSEALDFGLALKRRIGYLLEFDTILDAFVFHPISHPFHYLSRFFLSDFDTLGLNFLQLILRRFFIPFHFFAATGFLISVDHVRVIFKHHGHSTAFILIYGLPPRLIAIISELYIQIVRTRLRTRTR